jgi:RimJ/RimL family protein N-acetyltransferase
MTERLVTERLVLEPLTADEARAIVDGDLSGVRPASGWPHEDTADGLRMVGPGAAEAWLVTLGGEVIGDVGTHGPPDENGDIEVGFGLAEPHRGRRYAAEFVPALARALLARPDVRRVVAREVLADNVPSRRTLERAGFELEREERGLAWYALAPDASR